VKYKLLWTCYT